MSTPQKRLFTILFLATMLWLVPLIAMQFTLEVNWQLSDFLVAGVMLFGTGVLCEFIFRKVPAKQTRIFLLVSLLVLLLLVWAALAVGIFGSPLAGS